MLDVGRFSKLAAGAALSVLLSTGGALAATADPLGPYYNTLSCSPFNISPTADACYGTAEPTPTNAQQVNFNGATFFSGPDDTSTSTIGLFDIRNWVELQVDNNFEGGKTGSFAVGDFSSYLNVAVVLKSANTWAAYLFEGGLGPTTISYETANDRGLSNYVVIGQIPLPATGWLLLGVFGAGAVAANRKRKQKAA